MVYAVVKNYFILFPMCIFVFIWVFILYFYVNELLIMGQDRNFENHWLKNSSHLCTAYHLSVTHQKHSDCINRINFSVIFYDSGSSWIKDDIGDKCLVRSRSRQGAVTEFKSRKSRSVGCALGGYFNALTKLVVDLGLEISLLTHSVNRSSFSSQWPLLLAKVQS